MITFKNILLFLILQPLMGAFAISMVSASNEKLLKIIALGCSCLTFIASLFLLIFFNKSIGTFQFVEKFFWGPILNINFPLGVDGISLFFIILTTLLITICLLASWNSIKVNLKIYLIAFLVMEFFLIGVFCILDLLLFYIFFESVLIPMFLIIGVWGSRERKIRAGYFFFLYTLLGSVLMLLSILYIYYEIGTTDYEVLLTFSFSLLEQKIMWFTFFASFATKVPMVLVHLWLPEAPTAGSVILAGILLKLGTYGFIKFSFPFFPEACFYFAPFVYSMFITGIIYTSFTAIRQSDFKRITAYTSITHMNLVMIGLFSSTLTVLVLANSGIDIAWPDTHYVVAPFYYMMWMVIFFLMLFCIYFWFEKLTKINKQKFISLLFVVVIRVFILSNSEGNTVYCGGQDEINVTFILSVAAATGKITTFTRITETPEGSIPDPDGLHAKMGAQHYKHVNFQNVATDDAYDLGESILEELLGVDMEEIASDETIVHSIDVATVRDDTQGVVHWLKIVCQEHKGYLGDFRVLKLVPSAYLQREYFITPLSPEVVMSLGSLATLSVVSDALPHIVDVVQTTPGYELTFMDETGRRGDLGRLYMAVNNPLFTDVLRPMALNKSKKEPFPMSKVVDYLAISVADMDLTVTNNENFTTILEPQAQVVESQSDLERIRGSDN